MTNEKQKGGGALRFTSLLVLGWRASLILMTDGIEQKTGASLPLFTCTMFIGYWIFIVRHSPVPVALGGVGKVTFPSSSVRQRCSAVRSSG